MKPNFFIIAAFLLIAFTAFSQAQTAIIYKNESCGHCAPYLAQLEPFLKSKGFEITEKDFVNDFDARVELTELHQKNKVPAELQGHMVTVLNGNLLLEGHVSLDKINEVLKKYPAGNFPKIVIYNDSMGSGSAPEPYSLMIDGKIVQCKAESKVSECATLPGSFVETSLPVLVIFSGLAAGVHPCTIGVLLFFIAFLFTIRRSRLNAFKVGGAYILGVFIAYFLIGLGLLQAVAVPEPHFAAKIAAILIIALGTFNIVRFFFPKIKGFGIPSQSKEWISNSIQKASIPSALLVGLLVGICSFGCTAGIYLSIIGLLITQPTSGIVYLLAYNLMFILPLIAILIISTNKKVVEKIEKVEKPTIKYINLLAGLLMIAMGIIIWLFIGGGL